MPLESGINVRVAYVEEVTEGTTPASPTLSTLRGTTRNINLVKDILESEEVRASRQQADVRHGFNRVEGQIGYQLSLADFDDHFRFAMGGTWAAFSMSGSPNVTFVASGATMTRDAGSFLTDGFRVGDRITVANSVSNNGQFTVTAVTATVLTVYETVVDEGAVACDIDVQGERIDVGTNKYTTSMERQFLGVSKYQPFLGVVVNGMTIQAQPRRIINGTFAFQGLQGGTMENSSFGASTTAPSTNSPFDTFIGQLFYNGTPSAVVTGMTLNHANNRTLEGVIGSRYSPQNFEGDAVIGGQLSVMFEDETYFNAFFNETEPTLFFRMIDPTDANSFINIVIPRLKFIGHSMDPPQRGPVIQEMPFRALEDGTTATSISIQKSNS